jgi:hypothetical protein
VIRESLLAGKERKILWDKRGELKSSHICHHHIQESCFFKALICDGSWELGITIFLVLQCCDLGGIGKKDSNPGLLICFWFMGPHSTNKVIKL